MDLLTKKSSPLDKGYIGSNELLGPIFLSIQALSKEVVSRLKVLEEKDSDIIEQPSYIQELENKISNLEDKINNITFDRNSILKSLITDGVLPLEYLLQLKPRILPNKAPEGVIGVDVKDKKLKIYSSGWKTIKIE